MTEQEKQAAAKIAAMTAERDALVGILSVAVNAAAEKEAGK